MNVAVVAADCLASAARAVSYCCHWADVSVVFASVAAVDVPPLSLAPEPAAAGRESDGPEDEQSDDCPAHQGL